MFSQAPAELETLHFVSASSRRTDAVQTLLIVGPADDHYGKNDTYYFLRAPAASPGHVADIFETFQTAQVMHLAQDN